MRDRSTIEADRNMDCFTDIDITRGESGVNGVLLLEVLLDVRELLVSMDDKL